MKGRTAHAMLAVLVAAAVSAPGGMTQAAEAAGCTTADSALLGTVQAKVERHGTETGRADLHEMFSRSLQTMKGSDDYTTADIKARPDKQGDNWQGAGPNELWQRVYSELDRLEACRASLQDTTPPVITLTGSGTVTIQKGTTYTDAGATCVDDTDGAISPISSGTVDTTTAGTYTITYGCTDAAGNAATQVSRVVTVQNPPDTTPPVITLTGSPTVTIQKGVTYTDAGATCVDNTDGAIVPTSSGTVDTTTAGSYTITYSCTDAAGNTATQLTRTVTVQNAQPTPQDTPTILPPEFKFLTMSLPQITEGVPATFTLTSLTALSSPLDVVVNVQSPSGHLNSTEAGERTITVPTSGSANFTIYTINTPEAKEGTLVVNVTRPAGYTAGPGTIQLGIRDDPTPPKSLLLALTNTVAEGQTVRITLTSLTALSSPLDVVVNVQSPSGHLNSTEAGERTITIPASGTVNFDINTINTPAVKDGTLVVNIPDKLPIYVGTVTTRITITDVAPAAPKTPAPSANLVSNGSFETPIISGWSHVQPSTPGLAWTVSGGPLEIHHNMLGGASDGSQHVELDSTGSVTISQTVSTVTGQTYTVSFDYKARPDTAQSTNGIRVTWNGADIASGITLGSTWQTHAATVTGTGSDTISFIDAGTSDGLGTFLDNVSIMASSSNPPAVQQDTQPGGGTPAFVSFHIAWPYIAEGDAADFTISTIPAPAAPLNVTVKVSSPTGHINTANHTVTIPTNGNATLTVQTIDTPEDKDGTLRVDILDGPGYYASGMTTVLAAVDDPGADQHRTADPHIRIKASDTEYRTGETVRLDISYHEFAEPYTVSHSFINVLQSGSWITMGGSIDRGSGHEWIGASADRSDFNTGSNTVRVMATVGGNSYFSNNVTFNKVASFTTLETSKPAVNPGENFMATVTWGGNSSRIDSLTIRNYDPDDGAWDVLYSRSVAGSEASPITVTVNNTLSSGIHRLFADVEDTSSNVYTSPEVSITVLSPSTPAITLKGPVDGHTEGPHGKSCGASDSWCRWTDDGDIYNAGFELSYYHFPADADIRNQGNHHVTFQVKQPDNTWADVRNILLMTAKGASLHHPLGNFFDSFGGIEGCYSVDDELGRTTWYNCHRPKDATPSFAVINPNESYRPWPPKSDMEWSMRDALTGPQTTNPDPAFNAGENTMRVQFTYGTTTIYSNEIKFNVGVNNPPEIILNGLANFKVKHHPAATINYQSHDNFFREWDWNPTSMEGRWHGPWWGTNTQQVWREPGATCADDFDENKPASNNMTTIDVTVLGATYAIEYYCEDSAGLPAANVTRIVTVVNDNAIPYITGKMTWAEDTSMPVGGSYQGALIWCADHQDDRAWRASITSSNVDTRTPGTYTEVYTCIDSDNNWGGHIERDVTVMSQDRWLDAVQKDRSANRTFG